MTTVIIQSDSENKTQLLVQLAKELGLTADTRDFINLDEDSMIRGIGRKATDEELINYLNKDIDAEPIDLDIAFAKFSNK